MTDGIIYVCHSKNNKNVREGELEILRKFEDKLYFEFGENEMNLKKRFYDDVETLNKDFKALLKLKDNKEAELEELSEDETEEVENETKKPYKKLSKNSLI